MKVTNRHALRHARTHARTHHGPERVPEDDEGLGVGGRRGRLGRRYVAQGLQGLFLFYVYDLWW